MSAFVIKQRFVVSVGKISTGVTINETQKQNQYSDELFLSVLLHPAELKRYSTAQFSTVIRREMNKDEEESFLRGSEASTRFHEASSK